MILRVPRWSRAKILRGTVGAETETVVVLDLGHSPRAFVRHIKKSCLRYHTEIFAGERKGLIGVSEVDPKRVFAPARR